MKRRAFIAGLGSAAAWPLVARAQQSPRMRRIGILSGIAVDDSVGAARFTAFQERLVGNEDAAVAVGTHFEIGSDVLAERRDVGGQHATRDREGAASGVASAPGRRGHAGGETIRNRRRRTKELVAARAALTGEA